MCRLCTNNVDYDEYKLSLGAEDLRLGNFDACCVGSSAEDWISFRLSKGGRVGLK